MELEKTNITANISQYQFIFKAEGNIKLQEFNASAWRGIFGHAFKKVACTTHANNCDECLLKTQCAYGYIFESSPQKDSNRMRKYNAIPHPYVIKNKTQTQFSTGDLFTLTLMLFGKANDYLPYIIQAFMIAGKKGITQQKCTFSVESLQKKNLHGFDTIWTKNKNELINTENPYPSTFQIINKTAANKVQIQFKSPIKIMRNGKQISPTNFQLIDLIRSLTRRISMLSYFHTDQELAMNYTEIHQLAKTVCWESSSLTQAQWKRYSNRQKKFMDIRGITGEVTFTLSTKQASLLWPLLWIGSQIHAGKLTTMGLGEYSIKKW